MAKNINDIDVKLVNLKTFKGHAGTGFNADIVYEGVKIAHVFDSAHGGAYEYQILGYGTMNDERNKKLYARLLDEVASLPVINSKEFDFSYNPDIDYVVNHFVETTLTERQIKKDRTKGILVAVPENESAYAIIDWGSSIPDMIEYFGELRTKVLQLKVDEEMEKGNIILNREYLESIGVKFK